jgi:tetratricopeptide (TPR) repeat protein
MRIFFALALCMSAAGQHSHPARDKPVTLLPGLGTWQHPIATRNPEAQRFFDQGLVLMYGFNRPEALRSFQKTLELDPGAAMAHWGISMALGPYINMDMDPDVNLKEACNAARAGLKIASVAKMERAWLEAAAARCPDYSDPAAYIAAMRALATQLPDDPDAQTLLAESLLLPTRWKWYGAGNQPAPGVEEAERLLLSVLHRYPDHPGANHLYIHAVESSATPERAVPSALRLMGSVPAAGHMVHMPSHIWLALGDYATTVDVNERAAQVDRDYFSLTGSMDSYYEYYLHNLQFIAYAESMRGRISQTRKAAADLEAAARTMPEMSDVFSTLAAFSRARVGDWDSLLALRLPQSPLGRTFWHYCRALAFIGKNNRSQAKEEQRQFEAMRLKLDRKMPWDTNNFGDVLDLASTVLEAKQEVTATAAVAKWRSAVRLQDRLAYDEPPAWYYPVRESLGASLLLAGDAAGAESVFREGLRRSPRNGRMLFGLLGSLNAQKKSEAAKWVEREFQTAWKDADFRLTIGSLL